MNYSKEQSKEIASTILSQLGGNRFKLMTGSKNFAFGDGSLSFKVGRNAKKVTHCIVTLDADDTYSIEFIRIYGSKRTVLHAQKGVYNDMLQDIFTTNTELYTSL